MKNNEYKQWLNNLTPEEFQIHSDNCLSYSGAKTVEFESPITFTFDKDQRKKGVIKPDTDATKTGKALHAYVLEPERFDEKYIFVKSVSKKKKDEYGDLIPADVQINESNKLLFRRSRAEFEQFIQEYEITDLQSEMMLVCEYPKYFGNLYNIPFKGYLDAVSVDKNLILDIKTVPDISIETRSKAVNNYKYYIQAYLYSRLFETWFGKTPTFKIMWVAKKAPYEVRFSELHYSYFDVAFHEINHALETYINYSNDPLRWIVDNKNDTLEPPAWLLRKTIGIK